MTTLLNNTCQHINIADYQSQLYCTVTYICSPSVHFCLKISLACSVPLKGQMSSCVRHTKSLITAMFRINRIRRVIYAKLFYSKPFNEIKNCQEYKKFYFCLALIGIFSQNGQMYENPHTLQLWQINYYVNFVTNCINWSFNVCLDEKFSNKEFSSVFRHYGAFSLDRH